MSSDRSPKVSLYATTVSSCVTKWPRMKNFSWPVWLLWASNLDHVFVLKVKVPLVVLTGHMSVIWPPRTPTAVSSAIISIWINTFCTSAWCTQWPYIHTHAFSHHETSISKKSGDIWYMAVAAMIITRVACITRTYILLYIPLFVQKQLEGNISCSRRKY